MGRHTPTIALLSKKSQKNGLCPLATIDMIGGVDVTVNVSGGGGSGQAGAIRHGLSRALEKMDSG